MSPDLVLAILVSLGVAALLVAGGLFAVLSNEPKRRRGRLDFPGFTPNAERHQQQTALASRDDYGLVG